MLMCNWPHSDWTKSLVCKDAFHRDSTIQKCSRDYVLFTSQRFRFPASRPNDMSSRPDAHLSIAPAVQTKWHTIRTPDTPKHHSSGRRGLPSGPSSASWSFCSSLHPFGRLSSPSGRLSVIELQIFFPSSNKGRLLQLSGRHGFPSGRATPEGKNCNSNSFVRTPVCHRQDARSTDMEIGCRRSTVRTAIPHGPDVRSLIWKLLAADVRPSGRQCLTVRMRLSNRKDFQRKSQNSSGIVFRPDGPCPLSGRHPYLSN
jgi:hypothetical protein